MVAAGLPTDRSETEGMVDMKDRIARWRQRRRESGLTYCYKRCPCGALYAVDSAQRAWDCSDIILGLAVPKGEPGSVTHDDTMPFIFWKVKEAPREWALEHRVER